MQSIIKTIKKHQAERKELHRKLDGLTDQHFFTIAEFARNVKFNTGREVTGEEVQEVRALLCQA